MSQAHRPGDCDENCRGCFKCYRRTGDTVCDRLCPHRDENHPPEDEEELDDLKCLDCERLGPRCCDGEPIDFHD